MRIATLLIFVNVIGCAGSSPMARPAADAASLKPIVTAKPTTGTADRPFVDHYDSVIIDVDNVMAVPIVTLPPMTGEPVRFVYWFVVTRSIRTPDRICRDDVRPPVPVLLPAVQHVGDLYFGTRPPAGVFGGILLEGIGP